MVATQMREPAAEPEHPYNLRRAVAEFEVKYIRNILELTGWNLAESARLLGISPDALQSRLHAAGPWRSDNNFLKGGYHHERKTH